MGKVKIAPSMLSADFLHLSRSVEIVNQCADLFHMDIMDGRFVPNISFGFPVVEAVAKVARKPMDVHLMINHPEAYVERFAEAGAKMISFHLEAARDPEPILGLIRNHKCRAGLAINPDKPVEALFPYLDECDFVLLMTVFAGFGGQQIVPDAVERIARLRQEIDARGLRCQLEIDGGVTVDNAAELVRAGVDILVAGSAVFRAADPRAAVAALRSCGSAPAEAPLP